MKLKAKELRVSKPTQEEFGTIKKNPIYIIVDNVLDTYNIGAIFRLADAVAVEKVILCGESETPPNHRIKKASINTTEWVSWEYKSSTVEAIKDLREQFSLRSNKKNYSSSEAKPSREVSGIQIIAVEQDAKSVPYDEIPYTFPVALIVSHETYGASQEVLALCDYIAEMPMWGVNVSLNVMVSLGIMLYEVTKHLQK